MILLMSIGQWNPSVCVGEGSGVTKVSLSHSTKVREVEQREIKVWRPPERSLRFLNSYVKSVHLYSLVGRFLYVGTYC